MNEQNQITIATPDLDVEATNEITALESWAANLVVENNETRTGVIEGIKSVKKRREGIVKFFALMKAAAHNAHKAIVSKEKSYTDILDRVERVVKGKVLVYDHAKEKKRLEEQRRLQAVAEENARRERERLLKEAEKLKTPELKEQRLEAAAAVAAPVVEVAPVIERQKGEATRKIWKARVVDESLIPREWLVVDTKSLDAFARATKGIKSVSGVEFYEESSLSIRTGG